MAHIKKEIREKIWIKYDKHCAYCGVKLEYKQMQVDHIEAFWHSGTEEDCKRWKVTKGKHEEDNFNPSCVRCNRWKSTFTIEHFRHEIQQQLLRLQRDSSNYRMALDYEMITENNKPIEFFFERWENLKTGI
jgi:hypothetical protein